MSGGESAPTIEGLTYLERLGAGGYSDVYLYEQRMPRRKVAVKVLRNVDLTDTLRRQFTDEANAMAALADHPTIVPVFAADITRDGRPYLVMTYYPRPNLALRAAEERFSVADVLRVGIQVSSAVETAHRAGILHRDIKPANILTSQYGTPGLTDFGIAAQLAAVDDDEDTGVSVPWAPPEVLYATAPASVRSDVYSLGATLWHLLVGRSPYEIPGGDNGAYALMRRARDSPVPSTGRADVPMSLDRLLQQAMSKQPAGRPESAIAFARALQAVEQDERLPRTEIVVIDEESRAAESTPRRGDSNATRVRAPVRVQAQSLRTDGAPLAPSGEAFPADPGPAPGSTIGSVEEKPSVVSRRAVREEPPSLTIRRPAPTSADPLAVDETDKARKPHRIPGFGTHRIVVVFGILIVAAIGLGVFLASRAGTNGRTPMSTSSSPGPPDDPGSLGQDVQTVPLVVITGAREGNSSAVDFAWTYQGSKPGDTFLWQVATASGQVTGSNQSSVPRVTVTADPGAPVCLSVQVFRVGKVGSSLGYSAPKCVS